MSVINQMLKGLDKENQQQQAEIARSGAVVVAAPKNDNKMVIGLATSMVVVAALAAYLFMQKESHATNTQADVATSNMQAAHRQVEPQVSPQQLTAQEQTARGQTVQEQAVQQQEPELVTKPIIAKHNIETNIENNVDNTAMKAPVPALQPAPKVTAPIVVKPSVAKPVVEKPIVAKVSQNITRDIKSPSVDLAADVADSVSIKAVTRTPKQQAQLYATQAESALLAGDKETAKQLFVKVLAFDKQHDLSREKLAAIYYGEQRSQAAVTLLQQGLSISPEYTNFRLMLARIYLKNKNKPQAYYYLKPHQPEVQGNVDYYAILAGLAQHLNDLDTALMAYKALSAHEPNRAKWWLGLGITADKAKQVELALMAYHRAQNMGQLSASSRNYINARITQLEKQ